nr:hypothetical protein [Tanacetum cinerariifolium]
MELCTLQTIVVLKGFLGIRSFVILIKHQTCLNNPFRIVLSVETRLMVYCQGCALQRKKFKEDLFTYCIENGILQDSSEPSNDNTNVVNDLQEPNQDPEDIFCHQCTCELCGRGAHYGYNCPPKVLVVPNLEPFNNQTIDELPQTVPSFDPICYSKDGDLFTYDSTSNLEEEKHIEEEQVARTRYWKIPACYDDDDDDYTIAITHKEPDNSLSMRDEHLNTILATESDEFIKSSVENLVPNPSESEGEYEYDVPACEVFITFSNILFDDDYDFYSSDDQSFSDKGIPKKIYSNPLYDEEIICMKIDLHHFNVESDLIESLLNHDSSIISSSSKIDSLFDEFAGELTLLKSIPPDIDSFMEELDLSFIPDDPMPSGIKEDDYDSESSAIFSAVAFLFLWQWELSSLAVGTSFDSGNSITGSGNALCILFPTILP